MSRRRGRYADGTSTTVDYSRAEITRTLKRYGATGHVLGDTSDQLICGFTADDRQVRFIVAKPNPCSDAEERRLWRCIVLVIKSKLESVHTGIETFEDAFLANIVTPDGRLVKDVIRGNLAVAYQSGKMPPLLPDYSNG